MGVIGCSNHQVKMIQPDRVLLSVKIEDARNVQLVTNMNSFRAISAMKVSDDRWTVELPLQSKTEFLYSYLVDGHVFVPDCQSKEQDDFGGENCVFEQN